MATPLEVQKKASRLAEELLFPAALETDASPAVPRRLLDDLAEAGLYGLFAAREVGGLGLEREEGEAVLEVLASGCLTTTFVLAQHLVTAGVVSRLESPLRQELAADLASGRRRSGIAFSHLRRPDPPTLTAHRSEGLVTLRGRAPLVSGWGLVDLVHVAAREGDDVVWCLVEAAASGTLLVRPLRLAAVNASATVSVTFENHEVPASRVTLVEPFVDWLARDSAGLRTNGVLSLGVARRCLSLLGPSPLDSGLQALRRRLFDASGDELPAARAAASLFALDAASALVASSGGASMVVDSHAQRLAREALFLLVQGQTPTIRSSQLAQLAAGRRHPGELAG